jgi:hypothetical protein
MKPLEDYQTLDEWKEDMEKNGQHVKALLYICISKIMEDKNMTVAEAFKYFHQTGEVIGPAKDL